MLWGQMAFSGRWVGKQSVSVLWTYTLPIRNTKKLRIQSYWHRNQCQILMHRSIKLLGTNAWLLVWQILYQDWGNGNQYHEIFLILAHYTHNKPLFTEEKQVFVIAKTEERTRWNSEIAKRHCDGQIKYTCQPPHSYF